MDVRKTFKYFRIVRHSFLLKRLINVTTIGRNSLRVQYESKNTFVVIWVLPDSEINILVDYSTKSVQ